MIRRVQADNWCNDGCRISYSFPNYTTHCAPAQYTWDGGGWGFQPWNFRWRSYEAPIVNTCHEDYWGVESSAVGAPQQCSAGLVATCPPQSQLDALGNCVHPPHRDESCPAGHPCLPGTGTKILSEVDYTGAGAHPLGLSRSFRSYRRVSPDGSIDSRWMHNWQTRIALPSQGSPLELFALRSDGSVKRFTTATTTLPRTWKVVSGLPDQIVEQADASGQRSGFSYRAAEDDGIEAYDAQGVLQSITARQGWVTTLSYSTAATPSTVAPRPGLLIGVRNQFGRELGFVYDSRLRISQVLPPGAIAGSAAGSTSSPLRYSYDEAASLGNGVAPEGQFTSITWQDGTLRRYHYEDSRFPSLVTGVTDEAGVRHATYAYDQFARLVHSELVGGVDRMDFSYQGSGGPDVTSATVTDYTGPNGSATTRTYSFVDIGGTRYPAGVSAPCALCGSTQQASSYNAAGRLTRTVGHDGKVTFYAYDAKGRETERALFGSAYASATTRPALNLAESVTSTKWHATFYLPTQIAEPGKFTANTYNAKGMLTGTSWTATTDATGAAKFAAAKTGDTRSLGWSYNALSLNTTQIERINASEIARWTYAYNAQGAPIRLTDKEGRFTRVTAVDSHGRPTAGVANNNEAMYSTQYDLRGRMSRHNIGADYLTWRYRPTGKLLEVTASTGLRAEMLYTDLGELGQLTANGQVLLVATGFVASTQGTAQSAEQSRALGVDAVPENSSNATASSASGSNNTWGSTEGGVTGNALVAGAALNVGTLVNTRTGEVCPYVSMCWRAALGLQASVGAKVGVQSGPHCGRDWNSVGTQVQAVGDVVTPAGGIGANVGVGGRNLTGLGVGVGPGWGLGFSFGLEFCWTYVNSDACKNTPCECKGRSK
jgi:YD repeat-containing protein